MFVVSSPFLDAAKAVIVAAAPGMPPAYWWVTASILGILALAATIDGFTETVPDIMILLGLIAVAVTQALCVSLGVAVKHFEHAVIAGFVIWLINFLWFQKFRYDALGMGDAKWTMLAVACFGAKAGLVAWGLGSVLATVFILGAKLTPYRVTQVTFAPFLFVALCAGLYWIRFAGV